jgi:hypothetical protein
MPCRELVTALPICLTIPPGGAAGVFKVFRVPARQPTRAAYQPRPVDDVIAHVAGCNAYLLKPLALDELESVVAGLLLG